MALVGPSTGVDSLIPMTHVRSRSVPHASQSSTPQLDSNGAPEQQLTEPSAELRSYREWFVLLGAFVANLITFGWITSSGFFFDYYRNHQYASQSAVALSWLSALGFCLLYCLSLPVSMLCSYPKFGPRRIMFLGIVIDLTALILLPLTNQLYQLLIVQGIMNPLGASMVFNSSITILSKWFRQYAIVAIAITSAGGGIGGLCFPFIIDECLRALGFQATFLACTAIHAFLFGVVYMTLALPDECQFQAPRFSIWKPLREVQFVLTAAGATLFLCGYYTVLTFLVAVARERGMPNPSAALAIANGCSVPGRIVSGWIAKSRGIYNTLVIFTLVAWLLTLLLFAHETSVIALYIYCAAWGFFTAASISLLPAIVFRHSPLPEISIRIGVLYFIMSFGILIGAPIAATVPVGANGYQAAIYGMGGAQALGWCCWVFARFYETGLPRVDIV